MPRVPDRPSGPAKAGGRLRFLRAFARAPLRTGAIAPSSAALTAAMCAPLPAGDPVVVELGPGTGVFTAGIQRRLAGRGRHLAIELDPGFAGDLTRRFPAVDIVCADAVRLPAILADRGLTGVDAVVSGLPWAAFAGGELVDVIAAALAPDGVHVQFTYSWTRWAAPARRRLAQARAVFAQVEVGPVVWRNLPPADVHVARRPRAARG